MAVVGLLFCVFKCALLHIITANVFSWVIINIIFAESSQSYCLLHGHPPQPCFNKYNVCSICSRNQLSAFCGCWDWPKLFRVLSRFCSVCGVAVSANPANSLLERLTECLSSRQFSDSKGFLNVQRILAINKKIFSCVASVKSGILPDPSWIRFHLYVQAQRKTHFILTQIAALTVFFIVQFTFNSLWRKTKQFACLMHTNSY